MADNFQILKPKMKMVYSLILYIFRTTANKMNIQIHKEGGQEDKIYINKCVMVYVLKLMTHSHMNTRILIHILNVVKIVENL